MTKKGALLDGAAVDDSQEEHGEVQRSQDVAHVLDASPVWQCAARLVLKQSSRHVAWATGSFRTASA